MWRACVRGLARRAAAVRRDGSRSTGASRLGGTRLASTLWPAPCGQHRVGDPEGNLPRYSVNRLIRSLMDRLRGGVDAHYHLSPHPTRGPASPAGAESLWLIRDPAKEQNSRAKDDRLALDDETIELRQHRPGEFTTTRPNVQTTVPLQGGEPRPSASMVSSIPLCTSHSWHLATICCRCRWGLAMPKFRAGMSVFHPMVSVRIGRITL